MTGEWAEHFGGWYPDREGGDPPIAGLRALLAGRLDPGEYDRVVRSWRLQDLLLWVEERRVQKAFDDLKDSDP